MARRRRVLAAGVLGLFAAAAQGATTRPASPLLRVLQGEVPRLDAAQLPLSKILNQLARENRINLVVNWTALQQAGVTRETPVTVHLRNLALEDLFRALLLTAPARGTALNYIAGDNVLEVTTNAQIARGTVTRLYDITPLLLNPLNSAPTDAATAQARQTLRAFLGSTLSNAGEPLSKEGLVIDGNFLAVIASPRGQGIVRGTLAALTRPTPPGQVPTLAAVSVAERRAAEALQQLLRTSSLPAIAEAMRAGKKLPAEASTLSVVVLPPGPEGVGQTGAAWKARITPAGVVCIGPRGQLGEPLVPVAFDLRNLLRRIAVRSGQAPPPSPEEAFPQVQAALAKRFPDLPCGKFRPGQPGAAEYHGLLLVIAPAHVQRDLAIALRDLYKG